MKYSMDAALPEGFTLDGFRERMDALGYHWVQRIPAGERQLQEEIWELPNGRGAVRYVWDHFVDVPSVRAESDQRGAPGDILHELDAHLPLLHPGKLERMTRSTEPGERRYALRALASVITDFDWGVVEELRTALKEDDPSMRRLALDAIARYPYKVFTSDLDELGKTDPDDSLKKEARDLADDLRKRGKESQF